MKKSILMTITMALALSASAIDVVNTAGALRQQFAERDITSLTVTGEMNAVDFKFIADSLPLLTDLNLQGVSILAYSNPQQPLVATQFDYPANELPSALLFGTPLQRLVLPDGLQAIGYAALAGCSSLTAIDIPPTVTQIGDYAFSGSGLTSVTLPDSVALIGRGAFARCPALASAVVPSGQIGAQAFSGCTSLTSVSLGDGVTAIGSEAFLGTALAAVDATQSTRLSSVGDFALASTPVVLVELPQSVNALGEAAFLADSLLTDVALPASIAALPALTFAENTAMTRDSLLTGSVTAIGDYAFYNWSNVRHFYIPASVESIGERAMAGMISLEQIDVDALTPPATADSVWAGVNQPAVKLGTVDNTTAALYEQADQWKDFYILHDYLLGDVNGDGLVNVADINAVSSWIIGVEVPVFIFPAADLDENGTINIADLNKLVDYILGLEQPRVVRRVRALDANVPTTDDVLSVAPFSIRQGEQQTISIVLNNSQRYNAFQCHVALPEGLELVGARSGQRAANHQTVVGSGQQPLLMNFSLTLDYYPGSEGTVLQLDVMANAELAEGAVVELTDVVLADGVQCFAAPDASTAIDRLTGVDNLTAVNDRVYGLEGAIVIETDHDTRAQVVAVNGTTRTLDVAAGHNEFGDIDQGVYIVVVNGKSHKVAVK